MILWKPDTGAKLRTIAKETNGQPRAVTFSPDSKLVAFSTVIHHKDSDPAATAVSLAHAGTGIVEWQHTFPGLASPVGFFSMSVWVLCDRQSLQFLRTKDGTLLGVIGVAAPTQGGRWNDFATAKGDGILAMAGVDDAGKGRVQIWDISSDSAPVKAGATAEQSEKRPAEKRDSPASPAATPLEDKYVQELFKIWQAAARADGKIPGGLIGRLRAKVEEFISNNRNDTFGAPYAKKVEPILPRFDASHDWSPDEALPLLNDLAVLSSIPIETTLEADAAGHIQSGQPLPADLKDAPWGEPTAEGLRAARPLDPRAKSYPVGTALRSRILLHNDGKEPVLLRAKSWMQPGYAAGDGMGNPLRVESTYWTTLGRVQTWRLAPGEFCEIATPGLGVGKDAGRDECADVRVGSWIDVADGVDVTLFPGSIGAFVDDSRASTPASGRELKLEIIRARLGREVPLPSSAADRELVVRRVTKDIFGGEPTTDEISAFVTDQSDDPFTALAGRLLRRAGLAAFTGELKPGTITFRTTPADPDATTRPKVAIGPGRYTLDDNVRLIIVGKPVAGRRTSDVEIRFWAADQKSDPPGPPYKIQVPDRFGTWAITCQPRTGILWVLTPDALRKIDYSNPAQVKETSITRGSSDDMPDEFREAVKRILTIANVPAERITALIRPSQKSLD